MTSGRASGTSRVRIMAILTAMYGTLLFTAGATAQDAGLRIIVLEGEDSVNIIERGTAVPTLVEVRDRNDLPVSGAAVLFLLGDGDTATLNAGLRQVELTTDALGRAAVEVNPVASGPVELSVSATFEGETATATIAQTNFPTQAAAEAAASAGGAGGGLGTGAVVGIVGGVAAGAVGAVVGLAGDKPDPPPPPPRRRPSVPSALTVTAGDGQLVVSWQAASGNGAPIDDYEVQHRPEGGSWRGRFVDARSTGATITGLRNGTTYEVRVRAVNSVGVGDWSPIRRGTPVAAASPPSAPSALTVTAGDGQLVVSWQAASGNGAPIDDYEVQHRPEGGSWRGRFVDARSTGATITGLRNGTTYEVRVRAVNSVGVGDWSPIRRGTPVAAASPPSAPSALTVTAGDGQLVVSWQAPADDGAAIDDYEVQYRSEGGSWRGGFVDGDNTGATITGLDNGTTYEVRVRAVNSVGAGDWSPIRRGTPVAAASPPSAPSALTVTAGDGQLVVSWQAPADDGAAIDDYEVQYRSEGGSWRGGFVDGDNTGATITGLDNGTTYEVRVRAVNSVGAGDWSPIRRGTPVAAASPPSAPSALTVTAGDGQLVVSWQAPADDGAAIDDYEVQYRSEGGSWRGGFVDGDNTGATITGLDNGTTYEVRVRAVNSVGAGDWSPIRRGTPVAAASPPSAPSALTVTAGDGQLVVSWQAPADDGAAIDDYEVQYRSEGGSWRGGFVDGDNTGATITGLDNGTTYEVRVRAVNSVGAGDWSPIRRGTPVAAASPPSAPSALTVTAGDGQLVVSWQAPADDGAAIDDYEVEHRREGGSWERQTSTATTVTITGLDNGTAYEVRVRALNSVGDGDWSDSATGTPVASGDRDALVALYNATNGANWASNADWNSNEPIDQWYGVSTDNDGRVTQLILPGNRLAGPIPSELASLTNLMSLALEANDLTGTIPPSLGLLANLEHLSLHGNDLAGPIPPSLGSLTNLRRLFLYGNDLTGTIPPSLGNLTNLRMLSLNDNDLMGRIPPELASLTNLTNLDLGGNRLTGSIPDALCDFESTINPQQGDVNLSGCGADSDQAVLVEFYNAMDGENSRLQGSWNSSEPLDQWFGVDTDADGRVTRLDLFEVGLSGSIPSSLGNLTSLTHLNLAANSLTGTIPSSLGNLTNLTYLAIWGEFTGSVPSSLGSLTNLTYLELGAGNEPNRPLPIPSFLGSLTNLTHLELWGEFTGSIPFSLGNLTNLTYLEFNYTEATGPIPSSLGSLTNLTRLRLYGNQLMGEIPFSLGNLTNLTNLSLYGNQLTGEIPFSLGNLTNLTNLSLSDNQLMGEIPSSLGNLTNLTNLSLSDNQLMGEIPFSLGNLTNLEYLGLYNNRLTGSIPDELCDFASSINPQQGDRDDLPGCGRNGQSLEARLVPGDGQLEAHWTAPSVDIAVVDDYDVRYRVETEVGSWTELPDITNRTATSATITGLTNGVVYQVQVRAGSAAGDEAWSATATGTPDVPAEGLSFGGARVEDQRYRQYAAIAPLELPAATGGAGAVTYALAPALSAGLMFDAASRTISGTPSVASAPVTYTYTASDASAGARAQVSLSFAIEVEVSEEEAALRRDALAAQGRALLSSVTGVIGERFRSRPAANGGGTQAAAGTPGALGALGESVVSMMGTRAGWGYGGAAGGAALATGLRPHGHAGPGGGAVGSFSAAGSGAAWGGPTAAVGAATGWSGPTAVGSAGGWEGLSAVGAGGPGGALPESGLGSGFGAGGWDGLLWGRSFAAPLAVGEDEGGVSRYTVWGAGDLQTFSGTPEAGRYSGDVRSLYVGADGRIGTDWLAGAAVGSSWGAADYAAASGGGAEGRLTTRLTSLYPYVRGNVSSGLEVWAIGGYGWGEAREARGSEAPGAAGDLTMTMGAAGLRQEVLERGGLALAVVGGGGSLSLSTAGGSLTVAGLAARVHQARLAVEASRATGAVSPFVQLGMRYDGGDGQTGAGLEVVAGLRASTSRVDLEARGRWLSVHSAAGYGEYGASARLEVKSRPDGTGLRAALAPRWGASESGGFGQDGLLGGAGGVGPGAGRGVDAGDAGAFARQRAGLRVADAAAAGGALADDELQPQRGTAGT